MYRVLENTLKNSWNLSEKGKIWFAPIHTILEGIGTIKNVYKIEIEL